MAWFKRKSKQEPVASHVQYNSDDLPGNCWQIIQSFGYHDTTSGSTGVWCRVDNKEYRAGWKKRYELLKLALSSYNLTEGQQQHAKKALDKHYKGLRTARHYEAQSFYRFSQNY